MIERTEEHDAFRAVVRDFARRELLPHVDRWEAAGELPLEAVTKMADLGLFGIAFPEDLGGGGGDFTSLCIAIEEIGQVNQSLGITLSAGVGLGANPTSSPVVAWVRSASPSPMRAAMPVARARRPPSTRPAVNG
jgi:alkylation response protein AidB-like acyl-CoA dehydrogenase